MAYYNAVVSASNDMHTSTLPTFSTDQILNLYKSFIDYTDRKDTTTKGYFSCIRQFIKWLELNDIRQPQREDIKAYRDYLASSDLATGTQAQYLRAVKHFFKWTAAEGLYPNVADNIHGAKVKRDIHRKDAFDPPDVSYIAATIDRSDEHGKRLYAMFLLNFVDGLRTIELHRADVGDIKTIKGDLYLYIQGKGHDEKDTPKYLTPETSEAIKDYLQSRTAKVTPKSPLFTSTGNRSKPGTFKGYKTDKDDNIIYDKDGDPVKEYSDGRIATTTISTMFKKCFVNAGFDSDRLSAHSGRHSAAETALHNCGANIYETQQLMGHTDPATTEIYVTKKNQLNVEKRYRQAIYNAYFNGTELTPILPELEQAIMSLTAEEQQKLLAQIRAQKGGAA